MGKLSDLAVKYGVNKTQFWTIRAPDIFFVRMNTSQPLFKNNPKLKQAVNHAIDRPAMVRQHGFLGGGRTDQILPVGMPGYKDWNLYSLKAASPARSTHRCSSST